MGRMDEEQDVFEQLTLSDTIMGSSLTLKTFNKNSIIMANEDLKNLTFKF